MLEIMPQGVETWRLLSSLFLFGLLPPMCCTALHHRSCPVSVPSDCSQPCLTLCLLCCRLTEDPAQPAAGKDLPISAYVLQGPSPLKTVNLVYTIGFAAPTTVNMTAGSGAPSNTSSTGCVYSY